MQKLLTVDKLAVEKVIVSAKNWQKQADNVSDESTKTEIIEAHIDYGVAQGYLNCLRQLDLIDRIDYEAMSKKQKKIKNKLGELQEKRTLQSANLL